MPERSTMLGRRIRTLRKSKKMTQEELGAASEVGSKYISQIERSSVNLTLSLVEKVADGLEVELKDLFDFDHEVARKELEEALIDMIYSASEEELQTLHRVMKAVLL